MTRVDHALIVGCGDVGSRLGLLLAHSGCAAWGMRRNAAAVPAPIHGVAGDAADPRAYAALPERIDLAFYTAAAGGGDESDYRRTYVDGPRAMLDALAAQETPPRRVVFASSTAVYGQEDGSVVDEDSPTEPADFRGRVMLEAAQQVLDGPFPATVVRFGGIYGPGRTFLVDGVRGGRIGLSESGESAWTNRIHADDAARALLHIALLPEPALVYVAVDREPARRDDVVRWIADRLGVEPRVVTGARGRGGNKRCSSERLVASGFAFRFPTFREGYASLLGAD